MGNWKFRSRIYHWFRKIFPINRCFYQEIHNLKELLEKVSNNPKQILDLGTGIGDSLQYLPNGNMRILLDNSLFMLDKTPISAEDKKIKADLLSLPFKKQKFELITCIGVSEYIRAKAILLQEIYECLKPGGFVIITFSPKGIIGKLRNLLGNKIYPLSGSRAHDLIAAQNFYMLWAYKSKMQSQYLIQKL